MAPSFVRVLVVIVSLVVVVSSSSFNFVWAQGQSDVSIIVWDSEIDTESEFIEALFFAYDTWLTAYKDINSFMPYSVLTREQWAKMLGVFAERVLWLQPIENSACTFKDAHLADHSLRAYIISSCTMGVFKWSSDGHFYPTQWLTKAQWLAAIIRMFEWWMLDESTDPWYLNYFYAAREMWLTRESWPYGLDRPLTRYEIALLLYRFYLKYRLLSLAGAKIENQVINTITDVQQNPDWSQSATITVDPWLLLDRNVDHLYATIFGQEYKMSKEKLVLQFENAYSRFGSLYLVERDVIGNKTEKYVWNVNFNIVNWVVTDWVIRPFLISPIYYSIVINELPPFYTIVEVAPAGTIITTPSSTSTTPASSNTTQ
jgi:hypothetical protein